MLAPLPTLLHVHALLHVPNLGYMYVYYKIACYRLYIIM